jgi:formylglycine-generating enzyme required for sulfatase activity
MNFLIFEPLRLQLGTLAVLGAACAGLAGWWLTAPTQRSMAPTIKATSRSLPHRSGTEPRAEAMLRQKSEAEQERQTLEKRRQQRQEALSLLIKQLAALDSQMKSATGVKSAEQEAVERLKKQAPEWTKLQLSKSDQEALMLSWQYGRTEDTGRAVKILTANRDHWHTEAVNAAASGASKRAKQEQALLAMETQFNKDSAEAVMILRIDDLGQAATNPLLEAVIKLFISEGTRAILGENFKNSLGMEMVWVQEGGFWMGRKEVTEEQFFLGYGQTGGTDAVKDQVSFVQAEGFITNINVLEAEERDLGTSGLLFKPEDSKYALPTIAQWRLGRNAPGVEGFDNNFSEWTSSKHSDGGSRFPPVPTGAESKGSPTWPVTMQEGGPISLAPETSREKIVVVGTKRSVLWSGRFGFRVILIPGKAQ